MNREELIALADKILRKEASEAEIQQYNAWYNARQQGKDFEIADAERKGADMYARIARATTNDRKVRRLWPELGVRGAVGIAAAVAVITLGTWLFYASGFLGGRHLEGSNATRDLSTNDIAPGRNTATITFDSGEAVALNNEELDISSESVEPLKEGSEASSETPQFLASRIARSKTVMLSTPRGGTYHVVLPDGTRVWLNSASKIFFPIQFSGSERKVLLSTGEAYFEVTKNKAKPFIVQTDKQEVTVLGTHFNINAYPEEKDTRTTLLEGSVQVSSSSLRGRTATILKPNEQASLQDEAITVKKVNPDEVIAWKNGLFAYNHTLLGEVMRQASRWYDVKIIYEDESLKQKMLSGSVTRYDNISGLLNAISYTTGVKFKIEGRSIRVSQ